MQDMAARPVAGMARPIGGGYGAPPDALGGFAARPLPGGPPPGADPQ